jgi:uncharacterized protein involved in exopolysaccharide biosynthesis
MTKQLEQKTSSENTSQEANGIDVLQILSILWKSWKFIAIVTVSITVLAIIISLLLPEYFKSTAVLLPDTDKSRLATLGGISDLAALAGVNVGAEGSLVKLYPTIIKSESVLKNVIYAKYKTKEYPDSVNLIQYWKINANTPERSFDIALISLRSALNVDVDIKTNVLTVAIETREPQLSANIVNNVIRSLDEFIRTKRITNASEQRKWIEARLVEVKADLSKAENNLTNFREKNRMVSGSPQLLLDQERLAREVQINSTMYIELKKQYEIVKIEEIKNVPIINVMDYARPATKKERPKRSNIVIAWFFLALAGSGGYRIVERLYGQNIVSWYKALRALR